MCCWSECNFDLAGIFSIVIQILVGIFIWIFTSGVLDSNADVPAQRRDALVRALYVVLVHVIKPHSWRWAILQFGVGDNRSSLQLEVGDNQSSSQLELSDNKGSLQFA